MVRVRQLELCIDCKQCEEACAHRHGARRLTLGGFELGLLDFVFSCRSCTDARCLPPCEHDAIKRHDSGEVVIDPEKCIGCSLCALSCPYGAIDMVNVAEEVQPSFNPELKARLARTGLLATKRGKGKRGDLRRLANKCDHCAGYAEQACVSACPTGSLIEVSPVDLFRERHPPPGVAPRPGPARRQPELLPVEPFARGVGVRDAGLARVRDRRISRLVWALGLGVWLGFLIEVVLRRVAPELSVSYRLGRLDGMSRNVALMNVSYLAGSQLALLFGYLGTALMVLSMVYPLQRRLGLFRWSWTNKFWLDVHLMTGTVGPLFIVLHSALRLDTWVSVAFWSMAMVAVSGVLGRYLYTLVPSLGHSHALEVLDHRRWLADLATSHPEAAPVVAEDGCARGPPGRASPDRDRPGQPAALDGAR